MKLTTCFSMMVLAGAVALAARPVAAQGLLDQELGPKPAAPATDKPADAKPDAPAIKPADAAPAAKPVAADPAPIAPAIVSPEAAKHVDDQDLIRDLTQPGSDKPDPQKVDERMKAMLARMQDSAQMLKEKNPGDVTQETQRRIVMDLDVMIELARQQQQQGGGQQQPQDGPPKPGQARVPGQGNQSGPHGEGGTVAATGDDTSGGQSAAAAGDMRNTGASNWGGLPPRDRDAISHGANEEYLAAYKGMIDKYYQALAEMGKSHR